VSEVNSRAKRVSYAVVDVRLSTLGFRRYRRIVRPVLHQEEDTRWVRRTVMHHVLRTVVDSVVPSGIAEVVLRWSMDVDEESVLRMENVSQRKHFDLVLIARASILLPRLIFSPNQGYV